MFPQVTHLSRNRGRLRRLWCADKKVVSPGTVIVKNTDNVTFEAGNEIILNSGFEAVGLGGISMSQKIIYILTAKMPRQKDAKFKFFMTLCLCILAFEIIDNKFCHVLKKVLLILYRFKIKTLFSKSPLNSRYNVNRPHGYFKYNKCR
jgi:hypothetical protein